MPHVYSVRAKVAKKRPSLSLLYAFVWVVGISGILFEVLLFKKNHSVYPKNTVRQSHRKSQRHDEWSLESSKDLKSKTRELNDKTIQAVVNPGGGDTASFSACLYVTTDNRLLPEWLAYHYYMLPLRNVVVMDGRQPADAALHKVLDQWRPYINVTLWTDNDIRLFPTHNSANEGQRQAVSPWERSKRQRQFYRDCARYFRDQQFSWTTFHGEDEYLYLDPDAVPDAVNRMAQPGSILKFLKQLEKPVQDQDGAGRKESFSVKLPAQLIRYASKTFSRACITVSRTAFNVADTAAAPHDQARKNVPDFLKSFEFQTLKWLHPKDSFFHKNGLGKSILHVSAPDQLEFVKSNHGLHRVLERCPYTYQSYSPIRIRQYTYQEQSNGSSLSEGNKDERSLAEPRHDEVRMWLDGFCGLLGRKEKVIADLLKLGNIDKEGSPELWRTR